MSDDLMPPKKVYDLTIVEFLDYVTAQSQSEDPLFSDADIARFGVLAGETPKTVASRGKYATMPYTGIKNLLDRIWAERDKKFADERAA